LIMYKQ
ncbi:hypothetical protein EC01288_0572, partial [Escherichia coli 0.1288]